MEKIFVFATESQIKAIESDFDDENSSSGVFQKGEISRHADQQAEYLCVVDTTASEFARFSQDVTKRFGLYHSTRKYRRKYEENPDNSDIANLVTLLKKPNVFEVVLPADIARQTPWLIDVFSSESLNVEGAFQHARNPTNRIRLVFDKEHVTDKQKEELKKYADQVDELFSSEDQLAELYGAEYLNLYLFAKESFPPAPSDPPASLPAPPPISAGSPAPRLSPRRPDERPEPPVPNGSPVPDYDAIYNDPRSKREFEKMAERIAARFGGFEALCRFMVTVNSDGSKNVTVLSVSLTRVQNDSVDRSQLEAAVKSEIERGIPTFPWPIPDANSYSFEKSLTLRAGPV